MRGGRGEGGVRQPPVPFSSPSASLPPNPPKIHMPRKKKNTGRFFISESKHLGHGGLEVMGKEETIGLIRPGHTSPAEIKQKSLPHRAPLWLTLGLPVPWSVFPQSLPFGAFVVRSGVPSAGSPALPAPFPIWCLMVNSGAASANAEFPLSPGVWCLVVHSGTGSAAAALCPVVFPQSLGFWGSCLTLGLPAPWSSVSWVLATGFPSVLGFLVLQSSGSSDLPPHFPSIPVFCPG